MAINTSLSNRASGAKNPSRKSAARGTGTKGKVLAFFRTNGEWMAVVSALASKPGDPILSRIVPLSVLNGPAKRKADRWLQLLA